MLRLTLGAIRVAGEIVGQSALVNAQLGIRKGSRDRMWNNLLEEAGSADGG